MWRATDSGGGRKSGNWYWTVGILAFGAATASIISGNVLLGILVLLSGFAIMLAGNRPRLERQYALSEKGIHIDAQVVTWDKVRAFSIHEEGHPTLTIATDTLLGTTTIPLSGINNSDVRMELKNRNVEEEESLETFTESITRAIGL